MRVVQSSLGIQVYYEVSAWVYAPSINTASANISATVSGGADKYGSVICASYDTWTRISYIVMGHEDGRIVYIDYIDAEDGDIVYVDDVSYKHVGLVADYRFAGDYLDQTSNANNLSASGTGNKFIETQEPIVVAGP